MYTALPLLQGSLFVFRTRDTQITLSNLTIAPRPTSK